MVRKLALFTLSGVIALACVPTIHADLIIDNFTSPVLTYSVSGAYYQTGLGTDTIGGARTINYNLATDNGGSNGTTGEVNIQGGVFQFWARHNLSPDVTIIWNGGTSQSLNTANYPAPPTAFGLAADFSTNHLVQLSVQSLSDPYAVIFRLYGASAANYLEWDLTASAGTLTDGLLLLDVLNDPPSSSSGTVTLSDVQAITLSLEPLGPSIPTQISIDFIDAIAPAPVPEPGSLALLGAIAGSALAYRCLRARRAQSSTASRDRLGGEPAA